MKKFKLIILTFLLIPTLFSCKEKVYLLVPESSMKSLMEYGYFEGQKDAINNDIRVKLQPDSTWIWTKSPWDDGELPTRKPIDALNLR